MTCKNCNTEITANYCPNCGLPAKLKRVNGHYILHEIEHVLHVERGILYTMKELITRPGQVVRNYLLENRSRLVKPIIFIIVTSLIYTICAHLFHFEDGYVRYFDGRQSATTAIFQWVQNHYGYANIIMGVFISLWIKLFFRKQPFNIFEILILLCFTMGIGMLIYAVFGIIQSLAHIDVMQIAGVAGLAYTTWAIGQFYDKTRAVNYVKALLAYIIGTLTFTIAAIVIGVIIDLSLKH